MIAFALFIALVDGGLAAYDFATYTQTHDTFSLVTGVIFAVLAVYWLSVAVRN